MVRLTKIYTRTGDAGDTRLAGGQSVPKDGLRCETYGSVDELNALLGLVRAELAQGSKEAAWVETLQQQLFNLGCDLCVLPADRRDNTPTLGPDDVADLEAWIDTLQEDLEDLTSFILPGGDRATATLHLARTVCRRAERLAVSLAREEEISSRCVMYLNRLSDALFVTARWVAKRSGCAETLWTP